MGEMSGYMEPPTTPPYEKELVVAAERGEEILRALLSKDPFHDWTGETLLGRAVRGHHHNLVRHLLEKSVADIDVGNTAGRTPMHYAAKWFDCKMMHLLFEFGAKHSLADNKDETPMHVIGSI